MELTAAAQHMTHAYGDFRIYVATNTVTKTEHIVLVKGVVAGTRNVLCRLQSECLTGIVLDSADCECNDQMHMALAAIHKEGAGVLLFLRQEGRGHGLTNKIRALANKNAGYDTFAAVELLGLEADARRYDDAVKILRLIGVASINLMTNNPGKSDAMRAGGITVQSISRLHVSPTERTLRHLEAKRARGHDIDL
jgi:3,4-dihydroxy 2-butanone 4-phosphate synthase/GTP cyclohydrolase II